MKCSAANYRGNCYQTSHELCVTASPMRDVSFTRQFNESSTVNNIPRIINTVRALSCFVRFSYQPILPIILSRVAWLALGQAYGPYDCLSAKQATLESMCNSKVWFRWLLISHQVEGSQRSRPYLAGPQNSGITIWAIKISYSYSVLQRQHQLIIDTTPST